ncbi:hypothetical protein MSAN_01746700 [Mycena sanguinolenta]|uniref:Uncharacterized protein n=1 Tax=Mycena sanguinolenta TaxID=230812 RepID=A0A8H6XWZ6_9AGAR|nr:hypothetical protein MSAN_01746700 [Mycena sanguinolenta]
MAAVHVRPQAAWGPAAAISVYPQKQLGTVFS